MARKTKSKQRLDKYYRLAKEQGYRSRAAFKLIQMNQKYNFLQKSKVLLDLCAAPGGWLQIASKFMPSSSIIIGVDLDSIKHVPNCITLQEDITTQKCLDKIKKHIKHMKVDVVLNDGAPNVGSNWNKDAYSQTELVLYALKLACQVMKKKGIFVTKVFRSADYNSLLWVLSKLFRKVEANKPLASRQNSAEIFVVCLDYLDPDYIDPRFFDPEFVFRQNEADLQLDQQNADVNSIKKIFLKNKRKIIKDNTPLTMHSKMSFRKFIEIKNPYQVFSNYNQIVFEDDEYQQRIRKIVPFIKDFVVSVQDLKLLSKKDVTKILKWRTKVCQRLQKSDKEVEEVKPKEMKTINFDKEKLKQDRQDKKVKSKTLMRFVKKNIDVDQIQQIGLEDGLEGFDFTKHAETVNKGEYMELETDNDLTGPTKEQKLNSFKEMSENIEYLYEQKKTRNKNKKEGSTFVVDSIRQRKIRKRTQKDLELEQDEKEQINYKENNEEEIDMSELQKSNRWYNQQIFESILKEDKKEENKKLIKMEIEKKEESVKSEEDVRLDYNQLNNELEGEQSEIDMEDMNDEDLAELLAISQKMMRKKTRMEIIDDSYNRYNYPEEPKDLPAWFYEDERKHIGKIKQVTKEDVRIEKEKLRILRARLPKKVLEAKYRKRKRFLGQMKKAKNAAEKLFDNENISGFSKARQINELYKKAVKSKKPKRKEIFVAKKFSISAPRKKKGRKFKIVDRRMRKDVRKPKRAKRGGKRKR